MPRFPKTLFQDLAGFFKTNLSFKHTLKKAKYFIKRMVTVLQRFDSEQVLATTTYKLIKTVLHLLQQF